jgi:hypothetical protein
MKTDTDLLRWLRNGGDVGLGNVREFQAIIQ